MGTGIKFTGLSSGLDTQSVVESLLTPYQTKIDKVKANTTLAEWRKDAYKELSLKISNFRTQSLAKFTNMSNLTKSKATVSQEGVIKIDTNQYTEDGLHSIEIKQLATKATAKTTTIKNAKKLTASSKLSELDPTLKGKKIKIAGQTNSLEIKEDTTIEDITNYLNGTNSVGADGKPIDTGVSCKFDEKVQAFIISSKESGENASIDFTGTDESVMKALGIGQQESKDSQGNTVVNTVYQFKGQNAKLVYNGGVTVEQSSNEFDINGIKFTAIATTTQPITVSVEKDIDGMVNTIKTFVDEYNSLISEMSDKLYADSAKGYDPLTEEEKDAMTEKEIEAWESKIKDSLFRNDTTLRSLYNTLRNSMTTSYKGKDGISDGCNMLSQIGISSSSWSERGKLTIDEEKLREALANEGDGVASLLNNIAKNIDKQLYEASKSSESRSYGQFFNDKLVTNDLSQYAKDLITAQEKYDRMETYYYKKFTAMETALNKMNSQSSLFSSL